MKHPVRSATAALITILMLGNSATAIAGHETDATNPLAEQPAMRPAVADPPSDPPDETSPPNRSERAAPIADDPFPNPGSPLDDILDELEPGEPVLPRGPTVDEIAAVNEQVLGYFKTNRLSVAPGGSIRFDWSVVAGRSDVILRLDGEALPARTGLRFIHINDRNERHVLSAHFGEASRELASIVVGVNPCLSTATLPAECQTDGTTGADYVRRRHRFAYEPTDLEDPSPAGLRRLELDACDTEAGRHGRVERYQWQFRRNGFPPIQHSSYTCDSVVRLTEGVYGTTMTAHMADGARLTTRLSVQVKDLFIVSIGDSMASGEGNPDVSGNYTGPPGKRHEATWAHEPCHRSSFSGHARAAGGLSNADPHTGVTFLSLACTGATIENLTATGHRNQPPQLQALHDVICQWSCGRPIDLLIVTAGVNDLSFSTVVEECAVWEAGDDCDSALAVGEATVDEIDVRLRAVQAGIDDLGLTVRQVLVTEYPSNVLEGGCSIQTGRIGRLGDRLNAELRDAVAANAGNHWHFVGGIKEAFAGESYCTDEEGLFGSYGRSKKIQGDRLGTAHPDKAGHRVIAQEILRTYAQVLNDESHADELLTLN